MWGSRFRKKSSDLIDAAQQFLIENRSQVRKRIKAATPFAAAL
jgi:hypothetical protein